VFFSADCCPGGGFYARAPSHSLCVCLCVCTPACRHRQGQLRTPKHLKRALTEKRNQVWRRARERRDRHKTETCSISSLHFFRDSWDVRQGYPRLCVAKVKTTHECAQSGEAEEIQGYVGRWCQISGGACLQVTLGFPTVLLRVVCC